MTGSKFVEGILSCGVEVELAKATMDATKNYANQMLLEGTLLDSYGKLSLGLAKSIEAATDKMADVDEANANTQMYAGFMQVTGVAVSAGTTIYREGFSNELKEMSNDSNNVSAWRNLLHGGDAEVVAGPKSEGDDIEMQPMGASKTASTVTDADIADLRQKQFAKSKPGGPDDDTVKMLKNLRNAKTSDIESEEDEVKHNDMIKRGKAYDDIDKKLDKEDEQISSRRSRYDAKTNQYTQYINSATQAADHFAQAGGGLHAADERRMQATLDSNKSTNEYAVQNTKSAADMVVQGSQNSAGVISELNRAKSEIAQANRM